MKMLIPLSLCACASTAPDEFSLHGFRHWGDSDSTFTSTPGGAPRSYSASDSEGWTVGASLTWSLQQPERYTPADTIVVDMPVAIDLDPVLEEPDQDVVDDVLDAVHEEGGSVKLLIGALTALALACAGYVKRKTIAEQLGKLRGGEGDDG